MSRQRRKLVGACLVAASILLLLLWSAPSVALGPDTGKGVVSSPLGSDAGKPAPAKTPPASPPQGVAPRGALPPQVAAPHTPGKPAALPAEPKWPQNFELGTGERTGFGFVAGKPGPIVVTVKWKGAPLVVSLVKPGGGTVERQGNGGVTIEYTATADDVKKGMLWGISLRPAQEGSKPAGGTGIQVETKPVKRPYQVLAKGTVSVQHPPGDMKLAQAELTARAEKARTVQSKLQAPAPQADVAAQKQAALQKQQAARQAQMLEQVKPKIPAEAYQRMSQKIASEANSVAKASPSPLALSKGPRTAVESLGTTLVPDKGISPTQPGKPDGTGSTQPAAIADPVIASLSITSGQPGDPVLITGSGFTNGRGSVHFIVGNSNDIQAPVTGWNDTQIVTEVPNVSGVQGFNGQVYVRRGASDSKFVPFRFNPATEFRSMGMTGDRILKEHYNRSFPWGEVDRDGLRDLFGSKGDDQFFISTRLKNGWLVDSAYLNGYYGYIWRSGNADAYITEFRPDTDSPYLKVHWWRDGYSNVSYYPVIVIRGPKGVPHL